VSNSPNQSIWLGYDRREAAAFAIARHSIRRFDKYLPVRGLVLDLLRQDKLYYRPTENVNGQLFDVISGAPMSTEFSISRFLVPTLAKTGWALYADCDVMFRRNPNTLFSLARNDKAVMCVKHQYEQKEGIKMDGQLQTVYPRKNWSSVMLFNCDHPANRGLTMEMVNTFPGRDLHRFCWLKDDEIGELPPEWNYCVGHSKIDNPPALVHFTDGIPDMPGYEHQEFAEEWQAMKAKAVGAL
jgi:lipopolysaccharide biosynthesis glycosyltransferase